MFTIEKAEWDTDYFGVLCAKAELLRVLSEQEFCSFNEEVNKFQFVMVSNPDIYAENNKFLEKLSGSQKADTNILLRSDAPFADSKKLPDGIELSISDNVEHGDIEEKVRGAFSASRFHHDPHISVDQADGIYINWLRNAQLKENKYFCICKVDGEFAGLILFRKESSDTSLIELIFRCMDFRKAGVGSAMMHHLFEFCLKNDITKILVGTQERNETALKYFRKHGFKDVQRTHIFHIWKS